jgi:hypothetical protein
MACWWSLGFAFPHERVVLSTDGGFSLLSMRKCRRSTSGAVILQHLEMRELEPIDHVPFD